MDFLKHVKSGGNLHHGKALDVNIVDLPSDPHDSQPFCRKCDTKLTTFLPVAGSEIAWCPKMVASQTCTPSCGSSRQRSASRHKDERTSLGHIARAHVSGAEGMWECAAGNAHSADGR